VEIEPVQIIPSENKSDAILKGKGTPSTQLYYGTDRISNLGNNLVLNVLHITESQICDIIEQRLLSENRLIRDKVTSIRTSSFSLERENVALPYAEIIYTGHFKDFKKLYPSWNPGAEFILTDLAYCEKDYAGTNSTIEYFSRGQYSKCVNNAVVKKTGLELKSPTKSLPDDAIVIPDIRIKGTIAPAPENFLFLGRAATGNPHWRIEDSIFVAQEGYHLHKLLTEQHRFDYHLQRATGIPLVQRLANLILHTHSELSELYREINWKMNVSQKQKPKASSILEEGIDVIKLIFAIFLHFQYTPREISEMFFAKSEIVWEKFLTDFYGGI
jgi:hypothetical protein